MSEEMPAFKAAQNQAPILAAMPLFDEVKQTLYDYWKDANNLLLEIDRDRIEQLQPKGVNSFRAKVLQLYRGCRSKLKYPKDDSLLVLQELDFFVENPEATLIRQHKNKEGKIIEEKVSFNLALAIRSFLFLTDFLEKDKVTQFEKKTDDPNHALVEGLE